MIKALQFPTYRSFPSRAALIVADCTSDMSVYFIPSVMELTRDASTPNDVSSANLVIGDEDIGCCSGAADSLEKKRRGLVAERYGAA